jgi:hypothetical protein
MIVTITTPSANHQLAGMFEAMKHGLETEKYADNSFDLTVQDLDKAKKIANSCGGTISNIMERLEYPRYH